MNGGKIDKDDIIPPMFGSKNDRGWWLCKICGFPYESWSCPPHVHCDGKIHNEIKKIGCEGVIQKIISGSFRLPKENDEKTP